MMRLSARMISLIMLAALLVVTSASAASLDKGTVEISYRFGFDHSSYSFDGVDAGSATTVELNGNVGYCITDLIELQGGLLYQHSSLDPEGGESTSGSLYGITGSLVFNFKTSGNYVPYILAGLGVVGYDGDDYEDASSSLVLPQLAAGIRLMIKDAAAADFGVGYTHLTNAGGVEDLAANSLMMQIGISIFP